jgi:hypothetical protein
MFQLVLRKQFVESTFFYTEDQNPIPDEFFSEGVLITSD